MPAPRRPPTEATLRALVAAHRAALESPDDFAAASGRVDAGLRRLYNRGLPRGLDPAVVAEAVATVRPYVFELARMCKKAGAEYDAAIVAGLRAGLPPPDEPWYYDADAALVLLLAAATPPLADSVADAARRVEQIAQAAPLDATNVLAARDAASLARLADRVAPLFAPPYRAATLAAAARCMGPFPVQSSPDAAVAPQSSEEWALLVGCVMHPGADTRDLVAAKLARWSGLPVAARRALAEILAAARAARGAIVPLYDVDPPR